MVQSIQVLNYFNTREVQLTAEEIQANDSIFSYSLRSTIERELFIVKVFVVGANGQIGQHLVHLLKESPEHTVRAMIRNEEQAKAFETIGVETRLADLEGSVEGIVEAARGCDAFVFTAGSGGHTGADKTILIDLDGAAKSIEAATILGIKRFIMVSAIQANNRENWGSMKYYMTAKHHADKILKKAA